MDVLQKLLEKDPEQRGGWGEIENYTFWNYNEKGFYDAFPNLKNKNLDNNILRENINEGEINSKIHFRIDKKILIIFQSLIKKILLIV